MSTHALPQNSGNSLGRTADLIMLVTLAAFSAAALAIGQYYGSLGLATGVSLALLALCILTVVLGQLISNTATVLIMAPIGVVLAADLDVSVLPFMMALTVAGAAAFLTPVATPANTMVMEPGAYRFGDYWKLGLPLLLMYLVAAVFWVPVLLPF